MDLTLVLLRAQVYDKDPQWPGGIPEDLQLEIDLLKKLRHPHVVELFEVVLSEAHVFLVQELLSGGELFEHLLSRGACKEAEAKDLFAQVVLALDYLHELHVAHRDIKAENLVFTRRGHSQLKLIDFGTADTWTEAEGLMHCVGTPSYMAPEVVVGFYGCKGAEPTMRPYTLACDVWSIGVLLYELLSFSMPIGAPDMQSVLESVGRASENYPANLAFRPSSKWEAVSDEAKNLVRRCLTSDPAARPAVSELKADPWLAPAVKQWSSKLQPRVPTTAQMRATMPKRPPFARPLETGGAAAPVGIGRPLTCTGSTSADSGGDGGCGVAVGSAGSAQGFVGKEHGFGPILSGKAVRQKALHDLALRAKKSKGQEYWFVREISDPSNVRKEGGVKVDPRTGKFILDNVPPAMRTLPD